MIKNTSPCVKKKSRQTPLYAKLHQKSLARESMPKWGKLYKSEDPEQQAKGKARAKQGSGRVELEKEKMSKEINLNQKKLEKVKKTFLKKTGHLEKSLNKLKREEIGDKQRKFVLSQRKLERINRSRKFNSKAKNSAFMFVPKKHLKRKSFPIQLEGPVSRGLQLKPAIPSRSGRRVKNLLPRKKLAIQKLTPKPKAKADALKAKRSPKTKVKQE